MIFNGAKNNCGHIEIDELLRLYVNVPSNGSSVLDILRFVFTDALIVYLLSLSIPKGRPFLVSPTPLFQYHLKNVYRSLYCCLWTQREKRGRS